MNTLIDKLWAEFRDREWDLKTCNCGHLCARWVAMCRGRTVDDGKVVEFDGEEPDVSGLVRATPVEVTRRMGQPKRRRDGRSPGDVVLLEDGTLGVDLGYCLLTMVEERGLARVEIAEGAKFLAWEAGG